MRILTIGYDYPGLARGFQALGHQTVGGPQYSAFLACHEREETPEQYGEQLVKWAREVDAIIMGKGWYVRDPQGFWSFPSAAIEECARVGCRMVYWSHDDPFSVGTFVGKKLYRGFAAILTCCEGSIQAYRNGCRNIRRGMGGTPPIVRCVWPAFDMENWRRWVAKGYPDGKPVRLYHQIPENEKVDFALVGTPYSAGMPVDFPRIKAALHVMGRGCSMNLYGGPAWYTPMEGKIMGGDPRLKRFWRGSINWAYQFRAYAGCRVNWCNFGAVGRRYINDRLPFMGGVGAFVLLDDRCSLRNDFIDGEEVIYYSGWKDWVEKFGFWLPKTDGRVRIGQAFRRKILSAHTYAHRAQEIDAVLRKL